MKEKKLWGGRFAAATGKDVEAFTESVSYDRQLYAQDIAGSKAHARMLAAQGIISAEDAASIVSGLEKIRQEIEAGTFVWNPGREDVHMNIEAHLTELIGEAGRRLHTGRSRNDQVALDFRLWCARQTDEWRSLIRALVSVLAERAAEHLETFLPGCTHFQPAQPVSLAHHLLAYAWMFQRDALRLADARKRIMVSPLGAAALAGSTHPLDPRLVASELGMEDTFKNSLDAVSDRDFALETLFCGCTIMMHLSRLCEELIIWANPAFGFIGLPDEYATGSSIMPQKKNPDVAELMRGKTGRVYGALVTLLTIMKGLPLAYNRDLQEDKEPLLDTDHTVRSSLRIMAAMLKKIDFRTRRMAAALRAGYLNATELADYLAARGVPFRDAHALTGKIVAFAEARHLTLEELPLEELQKFAPQIGSDIYQILDPATAAQRRTTPGGTSPEMVKAQLALLEDWLAQDTEPAPEQR